MANPRSELRIRPLMPPACLLSPPPRLPPEHITGGPCGLIKIKAIACKNQRKRASLQLKAATDPPTPSTHTPWVLPFEAVPLEDTGVVRPQKGKKKKSS